MLKIPLNRVIAFAGPYIAVVSGGVATWAVAKLNVLGLPGLDQQNVATYVGAGLTFGLTAGLTWLGHQKWLTGHHIQMEADAAVTAAALAPVAPEEAVHAVTTGALTDAETDDALAAEEFTPLSDEEEFASPPPPDASNTPIQPSQDE